MKYFTRCHGEQIVYPEHAQGNRFSTEKTLRQAQGDMRAWGVIPTVISW
jgi:hypothetical protein